MEWIKRSNKRFFTLIELIVVIVVLGILAAIVIPNISSFKEEATKTAIISDARNIQTAVDMYGLDSNGATPTKEKATVGNPQIIEVYGLQPDYLRKAPTDKGAKFWLDANNTVWASMVDAPTKVVSKDNANNTVTVSWDTVGGANLYKVYQSTNSTLTSKASTKGLTLVDDVEVKDGVSPEVVLPKLDTGTYLVTTLDTFDLESAPTRVNTSYVGYGAGPSKDYVLTIPKISKEPVNQKPTAVMHVTPENDIKTNTVLSWKSDSSSDPEDHNLIQVEWTLNGVIQETMPTKLTEGKHVIELRVQDEKGLWSDSVSKEIMVTAFVPPFTSITFSNAGAIGRTGPTQSQIDAAYSTTPLNGKVTSLSGIQSWKVPATGTYKIEAFGAASGTASGSTRIGNGAYISGTFTLSEDENLLILVGQRSLSKSNGNVGGGGGTFITKGTTPSSSTPLLVAGGGGGVETSTTDRSERHGWTNINGQAGGGGSSYANSAGINGYGGRYNSTGNAGGGGGGFYGDGTSSKQFNPASLFNGGEGGKAFVNGGLGGRGWYNSADGGFGGGAGAYGNGGGAGGGGGYSGGANGKNSADHTGGGGGSYNIGNNPSGTSGTNTGQGKVIITYIGE